MEEKQKEKHSTINQIIEIFDWVLIIIGSYLLGFMLTSYWETGVYFFKGGTQFLIEGLGAAIGIWLLSWLVAYLVYKSEKHFNNTNAKKEAYKILYRSVIVFWIIAFIGMYIARWIGIKI